MALAHIVGNI